MLENAKWIRAHRDVRDVCPLFVRTFRAEKKIASATLTITARGVYEAALNGVRVGEFLLAPGWTEYEDRTQVQTYDAAPLLTEGENTLSVTLASGWYVGRIALRYLDRGKTDPAAERIPAILASLHIRYADGTSQEIVTDRTWNVADSALSGCDIYDGQRFDASYVPHDFVPAAEADFPKDHLIPQIGPEVRAQERIRARRIFTTPKGETVVDFGQNLTGVPEITVNAKAGDLVKLSFAEIMDGEGNFYTANYRSAKAVFEYICRDGVQTYHPTLTFYGFRYLRVDAFPGEVVPQAFTAVVVHSEMARTGWIETGDALVNRLCENVIWGQKSNYLDVPTDCPQRDERYGWTGDAQVFVKAASYNYDVERFFVKWLGDMRIAQDADGRIPDIIPNRFDGRHESAAWGDASTVCPWQIYMSYGDVSVLEDNFEMMRGWVDYITRTTTVPYRWKKAKAGGHYADWLGLDAPYGQYKGATDEDLIASAFYAYSTELVVRAGEATGRDVSEYKKLYAGISDEFFETYHDSFKTQTEHALALHFGLARDRRRVAESLAALVKQDGERLMTGFVGTPYILHALSDNGYADLAYTLLLRREFPSWIYPVTKGATTMWEHWDGVMPDGRIWSPDMNSYNHYAYGAVADWIYEKAAGIRPAAPGFSRVRFTPLPDERLGHLSVRFASRHGMIESAWEYVDGMVRYRIATPVEASAVIGGREYALTPGVWEF